MNEIKILCETLTVPLRKHFCKNYNIPIKIYEEPCFSDRCILFDEYFGIKDKLKEFISDVLSYKSEQEFLEDDSRILQSAIDYLRNNPNMSFFSQKEDMNKFTVPNRYRNIPSKDAWRDFCLGKVFISIDLKKANFQALRQYCDKIFDGAKYWEDFVRKFTDMQSKISSKNARHVILGAVSPKRQAIYEKYLICKILERIGPIVSDDMIYSLNNDEIIIDIGNTYTSQLGTLLSFIRSQVKGLGLECHINVYYIVKLGKNIYKQVFIEKFSDDSGFKFKKVSHLMLPFVIRKIKEEEPRESDYLFINKEGNLSRFAKNPLE